MEINDFYMDLAENENKHKALIIPKLNYDPNSQVAKLLPNTPIIARITNKKSGIMNNEMGKVTKIDRMTEMISVKMEDHVDLFFIPFADFNKMYHVAYCITCHKCQGATYNQQYTIHDWNMMDKRLRYVALSRTTQKRFINIV
jgi:ATP-dependent exoDNAse (exonuclease V) alpha subunit